MRRLWRLVSPALRGEPARPRPEAGAGSYARDGDGTCSRCGTPMPRMRRVQPVSVVWPDGEPADTGDFVWPVGTQLPVLPGVLAAALRDRFAGFEPGPVEGRPDLAELWVTASCRPRADSTLRHVRPPCPVCGVLILMWGGGPAVEVVERGRQGLVVLEGVEHFEMGGWEAGLARIHRPRQPGRGLYVAATELGDRSIFFVGDDNKAVICTDDVKAFVEARGCTNVGFLAAGEVD